MGSVRITGTDPMTQSPLLLSTITPVYNGAQYLEELVLELEALKVRLERGSVPLRLAEAVFVVDDAVDNSEAVLRRLAKDRDWVQVIVLSTNFGQHAATVAGILHSSGDWIATIDEDLQHRPGLIPDLLFSLLTSGGDLIYAAPEGGGAHNSRFRNGSSRMVKRVVGWLSGNPNLSNFNSFRLGRGTLLRAAAALVGRGVYLDVALGWFTRRVYTHQLRLTDPRSAEQSSYNRRALLRHAWRLLMSSEIKPLRAGFLIGGGATVAGSAGLAWTAYLKLFNPKAITLRGWASLFVTILFFGGLTTLLGGLTLEYVVAIHQANLGHPVFATIDRSTDALLLEAMVQDSDQLLISARADSA